MFHGWPHEVWRFPFHYYMFLRREYLKLVNPEEAKPENTEEGPAGITIETYDIPG